MEYAPNMEYRYTEETIRDRRYVDSWVKLR
jgi:hypothetical protein